MRTSYIIAYIFTAILAFVLYYVLQKIQNNIKLETFILVKQQDVFLFVKNPHHLPELFHSM